MIVIIAEKPSLARNIADAIGGMKKQNGYLQGDGYIVTWAFGHLFSLADIEYYNPTPEGERKWTMANLPCFPKQFHFELRRADNGKEDSGVQRQFALIRTLCTRADVDTLVNAGDADREGEIIVRLCMDHALADYQGPPKIRRRLWLPDQTSETIRRALADMQEDAAYDSLANEGLARTYIDWLYGVNLTRYATIRNGKLLRVGRVIVPIVRAIYERDMEIRGFKPEPYYVIHSAEQTNGQTVELTGKTKFASHELDRAAALAARYNDLGARVLSCKSKKDTLFPGKLYSLSTLQNVLGKKYKMSMADSLAIIQKLYESGYLTYPRTNSEYLATAEKDKVKQILSGVGRLGYPVRFKDSKYIFDDSKIESHSALTPTYKIPSKDALSEQEAQVYGTVLRRFVAVFCSEECLAQKSEIHIGVGDEEEFVLKGTVLLSPGWTKYDDYTQKDKILPTLAVGDTVHIAFAPQGKMTTPPRHYTIETLNNYLKNPFKDDNARAKELEENGEVDDAEDYKAIFEGLELGTEATRTGIIDNAKKSGYIALKKDVYTILPDGERLIEALERMSISMDKYKTSELGRALKQVYHGQLRIEDSVGMAEREIAEVFKHGAPPPESQVDEDTGALGEILGACPLCGKHVIRGRMNYGCIGYKDGCTFTVGTTICGRKIAKGELARLLATGSTSKIRGFVSKNNKPFSARLVLKEGKAVFSFDS